MNSIKWAAPLAIALVLWAGGSVYAQPQTKLTNGLGKVLIQAIWCSSLLLEESFIYDEDSEEAIHYETLAFDLGDQIDVMLKDEHGLRQAEVDEVWSLFDDDAYALAADDEERFLAQLADCETNYDRLL